MQVVEDGIIGIKYKVNEYLRSEVAPGMEGEGEFVYDWETGNDESSEFFNTMEEATADLRNRF